MDNRGRIPFPADWNTWQRHYFMLYNHKPQQWKLPRHNLQEKAFEDKNAEVNGQLLVKGAIIDNSKERIIITLNSFVSMLEYGVAGTLWSTSTKLWVCRWGFDLYPEATVFQNRSCVFSSCRCNLLNINKYRKSSINVHSTCNNVINIHRQEKHRKKLMGLLKK